MTIYDRVRGLCRGSGISVRELESKLGFSYGSIAKWKDHDPSFVKLQKVATFFAVGTSYFMDNDEMQYYENDEAAAIAQDIFENPNLRVLFDAARDADPEDLKTTYDMLMALKRKERGDDDDPA